MKDIIYMSTYVNLPFFAIYFDDKSCDVNSSHFLKIVKVHKSETDSVQLSLLLINFLKKFFT